MAKINKFNVNRCNNSANKFNRILYQFNNIHFDQKNDNQKSINLYLTEPSLLICLCETDVGIHMLLRFYIVMIGVLNS